MLSDEVLDKVVERLARRMEQANTYIIEQIGKSIKKVGTLSPTTKHELAQIIQYGGDYDKILRKLKQVTKINIKDLKKIFEEVAKNDYRFAEQFYNYRNKKFIKWEENQPLKDMVNAIEKQTEKAFVNIANVNNMVFGTIGKDGSIIYKPIKKAYSELLDEAILNVSQGKETFDSAMYRQLKEIGSGLKVISTYTDKDGVEHTRATRVDSVLRTQMKDALRQMHNEMQQEVGEQFDADGVEVSVHLNPAPDHEMVQGRQFSKEEFEKFQNDEDAVSYDGIEFPKISEETGHDRRSISEYNCYHYVFSIILGVSKPAYTNKELDKIREDAHKTIEIDGKEYTMYEATQLQRMLERNIREQKDEQLLAKASGNEYLMGEAQNKITALTKKYKELNEISGLPNKKNRLRVSDYKRSASATTTYQNEINKYKVGTFDINKYTDQFKTSTNEVVFLPDLKEKNSKKHYKDVVNYDKIPKVLNDPDKIYIETDRRNTIWVVKNVDGDNLHAVLKLNKTTLYSKKELGYKNSIIHFYTVRQKYIDNKKKKGILEEIFDKENKK